MRNPIFKQVKPNYRRRGFEVTLKEGKKLNDYILPFTAFEEHSIGTQNRVVNIKIEKDLGFQGVSIELENGSCFDFPADFVLYYCDPSYVYKQDKRYFIRDQDVFPPRFPCFF